KVQHDPHVKPAKEAGPIGRSVDDGGRYEANEDQQPQEKARMRRIDGNLVDVSPPAADQHDGQRDHEPRKLKDGFERRSDDLPPGRIGRMWGAVGMWPEFFRSTGRIAHDKLLVNMSSTGDIVAVPAIFH